MKRILFLVCCLFVAKTHAQTASFFNKENSLRIDFQFYGDYKSDTVLNVQGWSCPSIKQNLNSVIDTFNYGNHLIEVFDSITNTLIFSKGFGSLFEEWQNTPIGKIKKESFEMSVFLPMPQKSVKVVFSNRNRDGSIETKHVSYLSVKNIRNKKVETLPTIPIYYSGVSEKKFDLVIIPDGYSKKDEKKMKDDFAHLSAYLLGCNPYSSLKDKINITGVVVFSENSGITDPSSNEYLKTAINSSFNTIESDRYLMVKDVWKLNDIAQNAPFDAILVMCNTSKYGGGGIYNYYATTCIDCEDVAFVMTHELGHSISGLADEYYTSEVSVENYYQLNVEPWEPNITTLVHFEKKWKDMVNKSTPIPTPQEGYKDNVGVFEGGGYQAKGVYRPVMNCSMKDVEYNRFCPVCKKSIKQMIDYYCK